MITAEIVKPYRTSSSDFIRTQQLKGQFSLLREHRIPMYLTARELIEIEKWFLGKQFNRCSKFRNKRTKDQIIQYSSDAFSYHNTDGELERKYKLNTLRKLDGIEIPTASAILALVYPENYCTISSRGWRVVFGYNNNKFSLLNYNTYFTKINNMALELDWYPQEVDLAIWALGDRILPNSR